MLRFRDEGQLVSPFADLESQDTPFAPGVDAFSVEGYATGFLGSDGNLCLSV